METMSLQCFNGLQFFNRRLLKQIAVDAFFFSKPGPFFPPPINLTSITNLHLGCAGRVNCVNAGHAALHRFRALAANKLGFADSIVG